MRDYKCVVIGVDMKDKAGRLFPRETVERIVGMVTEAKVWRSYDALKGRDHDREAGTCGIVKRAEIEGGNLVLWVRSEDIDLSVVKALCFQISAPKYAWRVKDKALRLSGVFKVELFWGQSSVYQRASVEAVQ